MPRIRSEVWSTWRQILNAMEEAVFLLADHAHISGWNRSAAQLLGRIEARAPGSKASVAMADLGSGEPWRSARAAVQSARFRSRPVRRDAFDSATGRHWRVRAKVLDGKAAAMLLILRETTDLHVLHEEVRKQDRLKVLAKAVAGLAHEIRNPLFGLSSGIEILKLAFGDPAASKELRQTFELVEGELERLSFRLEQFVALDSAPVERSLCSLRSLVEDGWQAAIGRAGRHDVEIDLRIDAESFCLADRMRMADALSRVLENSLLFSPPYANVEIADLDLLRLPRGPDGGRGSLRRISALASEREDHGILRIRDQGPGFPEGEEEEIFEPFYTRSDRGAGLGLALAQRVIQEHGWEVGAWNPHAGGAEVYLCLPVVRRPGAVGSTSTTADDIPQRMIGVSND